MPYAGPVLWSSNPEIFGVEPKAGQNGTHLDMLHETPYCMGIAHEAANIYWAFNGDVGALAGADLENPRAGGRAERGGGRAERGHDARGDPVVVEEVLGEAGLAQRRGRGLSRRAARRPAPRSRPA